MAASVASLIRQTQRASSLSLWNSTKFAFASHRYIPRRNMAVEGPRGTTLFRELFHDNPETGSTIINLVQGAPGVKHLQLAHKMIRQATETLVEMPYAEDSCVLQYGPKSGSVRYRESLAKFLTEGYGDPVKSDDLILTCGATHGLHLVITLMFQSGAPVFVEDPTYFIAINMLKGDFNMNIVPVLSDEGGVIPEKLDELLTQHRSTDKRELSDRYPFWGLLYVVPTYNNPRGFCLHPDRCRQLIQIARKHDILVFCDDVYNLLHYDMDSVAPPRLLTYDKSSDADYKGHVLSNGTFSKIMGPGLRCGWIESGDRINHLIKNSNTLWSAGAQNHYISEVVATAIDLGLERTYLDQMRAEYKTKIQHLVDCLRANLPEGVTFNHPKGGYFIWVELPKHIDSAAVCTMALKQHNVRTLPGRSCSPTGNFANCIRVSFSYQDEDTQIEGARRLCQAITEYMKTHKN